MPSALVSSDCYSRPSESQAAAGAIPIFVNGTYHVFYLTTPPNTIRHPPRLRSTWSRIQSQDLISWKRDHVEAIYPGKLSDSPDADGAWTGSAVIGLDGNMHLFYTGYNLSQGGKQVILHARSSDKHASAFTKSASAIRINGDISKFEDIDFRDAHVSWNEPERCFWMLVATRLRSGPYWTRGCLALLTSPDLKDWMIDSEPFYAPNDMFCPECPEIFSLPNGKWYLVYSRFHAPDAGPVYRIGDSPRGPFRTPRGTSRGRFDARRWYAAKSCEKAGDPGTRVYFGWVADRLDGQWSWGGDMGIPREVFADNDGRLVVKPSRGFLESSISSATQKPSIPSSLELNTVAETRIQSLSVNGSHYWLEFNIASYDAASFGAAFRTDAGMEGIRLRFTPTTSNLTDMTLIRYPPPLDDFWADQYNLHLPREVDGPELSRHAAIDVRTRVIVVVRSDVLEIFAGGKSISYRLPHRKGETMERHETVSNGHTNGVHQNGNNAKGIEDLGLFVEDGDPVLQDITLRELVATD